MISRLSTDSISSSVPKPNDVRSPLGGGVDPAPLVARERPLLVVGGDDVLAQLRPERLEQVAQVPDDREVAQDRAAALHQVVADEAGETGCSGTAEAPRRGHGDGLAPPAAGLAPAPDLARPRSCLRVVGTRAAHLIPDANPERDPAIREN